MSMRKSQLLVLAVVPLALAFGSAALAADTPGLGKPITEADIAPWDITVFPDGTGLPPGSGTAAQGTKIYAEKCAACHGDGGKGGPAGPPLVGGPPLSSGIEALKTVGNYYGDPTPVFDFIRRAMPFNEPKTLTNDEVYAVTAYLFSLNKIVGENDVMNAQTLPQVKMPNRDNFIIHHPDRI
jgi:S-disulfanyl-L-cysteine oxidoreductase SoxD